MSSAPRKTTARKSTGPPPRSMMIKQMGAKAPRSEIPPNNDVVTLDDDDDIDDSSESDHYMSDDDSDSFDREPEKILAKRVITLVEYRIKWKDCADWATEEVLHSPTLIAEYEKNLKKDQESQIQAQKRAATGSPSAKEEVENKKVKLTATEDLPVQSEGFDESLVAEKIVAATRNGKDGELKFLVKWQDKSEATLVTSAELNRSNPQVVINFYEERLKVSPEQWITA